MVEQAKDLDGLIDENYVPSSVERKKALIMYFFVGIIAALSKEEVSVYEMFHLKQALGRRMLFFIFLIGSVIFIFIPWLWIIPVILFIIYLIIRVIFAKQAREGVYVINEDKILMPLFAWLGGWIITVFELDVIYEDEE